MKFRNLRNLQVAKFHRLRNFAGCQFSQPANTAHLCLMTAFSPTFWWFYTTFPSCNFGSLTHFCNFLIHLYKLSHACNQINFLSLHQSIKQTGHEASFPAAVGDFFIFSLHFLGSQTGQVYRHALCRCTLPRHAMSLSRGTMSRHALGQRTLSRHVMALGRGTVARHGIRPRHLV